MNILDLQNVSKSYPHASGSVQVLHQLNAEIAEGESVAIVGPSGSGKSTLLSLMAGLDRPDTGQLVCLGEDLSAMNEQKLSAFRARTLSIVFQQFRLMPHMTALENVRLPMDLTDRPDPIEKSRAALEEVGLGHRIDHFPAELSGGECQRVAIARAMVTEPRLILADEPSGNLDTDTGEKVMDLLFSLVSRRGSTLILVTHDRELAKRCKRILVLNRGRFD